ncbi:MAG: hypothetical protein ACK58L_06420, partial [Planctomycetota bacterium]
HQCVVNQPQIESCLIDAFCQMIHERQVFHEWSEISLRTQHCCDVLMRSARNERIEVVEPLIPLAGPSN